MADAFENDFGAAVVELHGTMDFDEAAFEAAYVARIVEIGGKDDH